MSRRKLSGIGSGIGRSAALPHSVHCSLLRSTVVGGGTIGAWLLQHHGPWQGGLPGAAGLNGHCWHGGVGCGCDGLLLWGIPEGWTAGFVPCGLVMVT
jgi:hypothetical protein